MHRRRFLTTTGLAAATAALAPFHGAAAEQAVSAAPAPVRVGSQLYGWGQYYARSGKKLDDHLDEVLMALRDAGYDYAEGTLNVGQPDENARFAARLRARQLRPVSLYTGGALHDLETSKSQVERLATAAQAAYQAGFGILNINPDSIGRPKTNAELIVQAEALTELGVALRKIGMKLGVHHHTPEFANEAAEYHSNFRRVPKDVLGFCYDVHWVFRGGGIRPQECLPQYGDRVVSWHLRQSREKIWWEDLDTGDLDYGFVARYAREHRLPANYTVELALEDGTRITRTVVENHARSRTFLRRVFEA